MPILKGVIGVIARLDTQAIIVKEVNMSPISYILLLTHCTAKRFSNRLTVILLYSSS